MTQVLNIAAPFFEHLVWNQGMPHWKIRVSKMERRKSHLTIESECSFSLLWCDAHVAVISACSFDICLVGIPNLNTCHSCSGRLQHKNRPSNEGRSHQLPLQQKTYWDLETHRANLCEYWTSAFFLLRAIWDYSTTAKGGADAWSWKVDPLSQVCSGPHYSLSSQ